MSEEFPREISKLEVRLETFLKEEEEFVKELRNCLEKLKELSTYEKSKMKLDPQKITELTKLREEVIKTISETLKKQSKAEHEKSHLLESYGALIWSLEEKFRHVT